MLNAVMRTTLTLEPDIAERLKQEAALGKQPFKALVNNALRKGLGLERAKPAKRYRIIPHSSAFLPGVDPTKLNQLADESEAVAFLKHQRQRP
jgi:hypothetical protein